MKSQNTRSSALQTLFLHCKSSKLPPYLKTRPGIVWPRCVRKEPHLQPNEGIDSAALCSPVKRVIDFPAKGKRYMGKRLCCVREGGLPIIKSTSLKCILLFWISVSRSKPDPIPRGQGCSKWYTHYSSFHLDFCFRCPSNFLLFF